MAAADHDVTVFGVDEQLLLEQVHQEDQRMAVLRADPGQDVTWLYTTDRIRLGMVTTTPGGQRRYRRTLDADEIQYQAHGHRTLITQRGILDLEPGDFVRIPLGISHASVVTEPGDYVSLLSHQELHQVAETARTANAYTPEQLPSLTVEVH